MRTVRALAAVSLASAIAACSFLTSFDGLAGGTSETSDGGTGGPVGPDGAPSSLPDVGFPTPAPEGGASDAGVRDSGTKTPEGGGTLDAGNPFKNLVQIDVRPVLTTNAIVTTTTQDAGAPLVWMDGFFGQHELATQSAINAFAGSAGRLGLPNTALFGGDGVTVPRVQLFWSDGANGGASGNSTNCALIQNDVADAGTANAITFAVPQAAYEQVQVYVTGTHGSAGVASYLGVTLVYADKTTESSTVMVPAWDTSLANVDAGPGAHVLMSGLTAIDESNAALTNFTATIFAIDLDPIATKSLLAVTLLDLGGDPGQYAFETVLFYGATAW